MADSCFEIAQQPADQVPAVRTSNFDIALAIDPNDAVIVNTDGGQFLGAGAFFVGQIEQYFSRHFNELHSDFPVVLKDKRRLALFYTGYRDDEKPFLG